MPPTEQQYYKLRLDDASHHMEQQSFWYSQCNGKKRAVCVSFKCYNYSSDGDPDSGLQISINYYCQPAEYHLNNCINGAYDMSYFLAN